MATKLKKKTVLKNIQKYRERLDALGKESEDPIFNLRNDVYRAELDEIERFIKSDSVDEEIYDDEKNLNPTANNQLLSHNIKRLTGLAAKIEEYEKKSIKKE